MIERIVWWELGLVVAVFILAGSEWVQLWLARRRGLTANVSRLVSHALVMALLVVYAAYVLLHWRTVDVEAALLAGGGELSTTNWAYLLLGVSIGLVVAFDLAAVAAAFGKGYTRDVSRILSHLAMLVVLVVLASLSAAKWDIYLESIAATYQESIPAGDRP